MQREPHRNGNGSHPEHHAEHVVSSTKHLEELKKAQKNSHTPDTKWETVYILRANDYSAEILRFGVFGYWNTQANNS